MTSYSEIEARVAKAHLAVFGAFHPGPEDGVPASCKTLLLLGPKEPGFWAHFSGSAEALDGQPDPMDRWSRQSIGRIACDLGAKALFPFGGPPYHPFIAWAKRTGRAWTSPVTLLVHDTAGLMVSYRGALALKEHIALPDPPGQSACQTCSQPCKSACPVDALGAHGYDTHGCRSYLETDAGQDCCAAGCLVRRACPVSQRYERRPEQSAYHMRQFVSG